MPDPLSADTVTRLRSDPTAALAALLILAGSFPELLAWAQRTIVPAATKPNGVCHDKARKANGALKANGVGARAKGSHNPREAAAEHDQALLALMRANPEATVTELIRLSGRPRNSAVLSLARLEKAGLVEHASRGKWTVVDPDLVDPELVEAPVPNPRITPGSKPGGSGGAGWIEPLSGAHVAKHTAAMRVPDRLVPGHSVPGTADA